MIGSLRGRILAKTPPPPTVGGAGVGYGLGAPPSPFFPPPPVGADVHLLTHLVVREDAHVLYGFGGEEERRLFRSFIKVSGVGPKIALALLSGMSVNEFHACVQGQDIGSLTHVPGIGRKTAERLIVEMRDRLAAPELTAGGMRAAGAVSPEAEAYDALVALGYRPAEATRLLKGAGPGTQSTEELIRRALKSAVRE